MSEIFSIDVDTLGDLKPSTRLSSVSARIRVIRSEILQGAVDRLAETPNLMLVDVSSVYRTAPVGNTNQPDLQHRGDRRFDPGAAPAATALPGDRRCVWPPARSRQSARATDTRYRSHPGGQKDQ